MQRVSCSKCVELWREYAEATRQHVQLLKKQEVCVADPVRFRELEPETARANARRDSARAGIRMHLALEHADQASNTLKAG
jgi:hypothetical protein